jgi:hypothetical protein
MIADSETHSRTGATSEGVAFGRTIPARCGCANFCLPCTGYDHPVWQTGCNWSFNHLDPANFGRILDLGGDFGNFRDTAHESTEQMKMAQAYIAVLFFGAVVFGIGLWAAQALRAATAEKTNKAPSETREATPADYTHA